MALEAVTASAVRRVVEGFDAYAKAQGWTKSDYTLYLRPVPAWNRIHALLVAKAFPGADDHARWLSVIHFLEDFYKDEPLLGEAISLSLMTSDQEKQGGLYGVPENYQEPDDLLLGRVPDWPPTVDAIS